TCFCVSGKAGGYVWVRISKDKIIAALKKVKTGELKLGVFAKVKRKKHSNSPTSNYKYFVIVEALTKINKIPPPVKTGLL
ncbi:MAG: hypothetical protein KAV18_05485, partial [Candidatus Omnitrophica bacterium]|nr:hypothetical protein [Candidatus Omnitrophota bacterium]